VTDTGVGMDEDTTRRCLEPFFTTKCERGTGPGLAMVYGSSSATARRGAAIDIVSAPDQGTTVRLSFSVTAEADDDPVVLASLRDTLGQDGHAVTVAAGGQAGIDAAHAMQGAGRSFEAVFTDLGMP